MPNQTAPQYEGHVVMTRRGETWDCPVSYVAKAKAQGWRPLDEDAPTPAPAGKPRTSSSTGE